LRVFHVAESRKKVKTTVAGAGKKYRDLRVAKSRQPAVSPPHIKTADGAGRTCFKRISAFFLHRPRAVEMRRYNH
jgi:hypothetical protein